MSNTVINTNVLALNAHRSLKGVGNSQSKSSARLSSGLRINSAADDAAGLAISEKMRAQIRGLDQASTNAQDAVSLLQTAEGGMQEIDNMIQRVRELVNQASSDTNEYNEFKTSDRDKIQDEINALVTEIDSMSERVEFNKKKLLNGDALGESAKNTKISDVTKQLANIIGSSLAAGTSTTGLEVSGATAAAAAGTNGGAIGSAFDAASGLSSLASAFTSSVSGSSVSSGAATNESSESGSLVTSTSTDGTFSTSVISGWNSTTSTDTQTGAATSDTTSTSTSDGATSYSATGSAASDFTDSTSASISGTISSSSSESEGTVSTTENSISTTGTSSSGNPTNSVSTGATSTLVSGLSNLAASDITDREKVNAKLAEIDQYIKDREDAGSALSTEAKQALNQVKSSISKAYESTAQVSALVSSTKGLDRLSGGQELFLQVGANANQGFSVSISSVKSDILGMGDGYGNSSINVTKATGSDITGILANLDTALSYVTTERSKLGATQNRLEYTMNSLNISSENLSAAESRIRDTDMAKEMMNLTKSNVLQQAATSMLAQANQAPQNVLQLLQ